MSGYVCQWTGGTWVEQDGKWALVGGQPVRPGPMDTPEKVEADLRTLPALRDWYAEVYLHGGWHKYSRRPPRVEMVREADGKDIYGDRTVYRTRVRDLERRSGVIVEESSRETTLALIREMRRAGWSEDEAWTMMFRAPAKGTAWLRALDDPEREFERCWRKAGVPTSELGKRKQQRHREGAAAFVVNKADRAKVLAYVEANPGLGTRELLRSGCGLDGRHHEGRIKGALKVLRAEGRIRTESGARRAVLHYAVAVADALGQRQSQNPSSAVTTGWKDVMPQSSVEGGNDPVCHSQQIATRPRLSEKRRKEDERIAKAVDELGASVEWVAEYLKRDVSEVEAALRRARAA